MFVGNGFAVVVVDPAPGLDGAAIVVNGSGVVPDDYKLDPPVNISIKFKKLVDIKISIT